MICNVLSGTHWVIAYEYNGDTILVKDPKHATVSYKLNEIVHGQTRIYAVPCLEKEVLTQ